MNKANWKLISVAVHVLLSIVHMGHNTFPVRTTVSKRMFAICECHFNSNGFPFFFVSFHFNAILKIGWTFDKHSKPESFNRFFRIVFFHYSLCSLVNRFLSSLSFICVLRSKRVKKKNNKKSGSIHQFCIEFNFRSIGFSYKCVWHCFFIWDHQASFELYMPTENNCRLSATSIVSWWDIRKPKRSRKNREKTERKIAKFSRLFRSL